MTNNQIKANLEDAAASWARRIERDRLETADHHRRLSRQERSIEALIVAGAFLAIAAGAGLLWIWGGL